MMNCARTFASSADSWNSICVGSLEMSWSAVLWMSFFCVLRPRAVLLAPPGGGVGLACTAAAEGEKYTAT